MKLLMIILIFCISLFMYLHVFFHLKTSDDLEIYDIDQPSKVELEEVCDLRQPVRMKYNNDDLMSVCDLKHVIDKYYAFDVCVRNVKDKVVDVKDLYLPLRMKNAVRVIGDDKEEKYIIESNGEFLKETGIEKAYRNGDTFIRPYMTSNASYDYLMGSKGAKTPFRYDINYRNYLFVVSGSARIKLAPPKSAKYLNPVKDYNNFEFRSSIDPWNVKANHQSDFDKVKCLDVEITKGHLLFIPAFWWNSIEFGENTVLASFKYNTYVSNISMIHHYVIKFLQSQNIKYKTISTLKHEPQSNETQTETQKEGPKDEESPKDEEGPKDEKR